MEKNHISGAPQGIILDMVKGTADFHENINQKDGPGQR